MELDLEQQKKLLLLARKTVADFLKIENNIGEIDLSDPVFSEKRGVFVTLHISGNLRGCIGYIIAYAPLKDAVVEMAMSAAFRDPRFMSLNRREYPGIDIEISVLSPIDDVKNIDDIVVGRHGLIASRDGRQGLLLPQVPVEQGWGRDEFLMHTCLKAGLPPDAWRNKNTRLQSFTAQVFGEKELGML